MHTQFVYMYTHASTLYSHLFSHLTLCKGTGLLVLLLNYPHHNTDFVPHKAIKKNQGHHCVVLFSLTPVCMYVWHCSHDFPLSSVTGCPQQLHKAYTHTLTYCKLRARRALLHFKDATLITWRALSQYEVYCDSTLLVLNKTYLNCNNVLLALNWHQATCTLTSTNSVTLYIKPIAQFWHPFMLIPYHYSQLSCMPSLCSQH